MQDEHEPPHLPTIDASRASDESVLRVHAQLRRSRVEGSPVAFFTTLALTIVFVFGWFYARRYFAELDSGSVLAERDQIAAMARYLEEGAGPAEPEEVDGAELYAQQCVACHQANGEGMAGAFPPLAGSEWVTGDAELPIKVLLSGLGGPVEVKGQSYNGAMPAFGAVWNDEEIAAVVTYIRAEWGNEAGEVDAEQVAAVREETGSRGTWTADELQEYFQ